MRHLVKRRKDHAITALTLHFAPMSCAFVSLAALEAAGHPFEVKPVSLMVGGQRSPDYLAVNPKGKVPALVVDGRALTETVAILAWLAGRFPEAKLLPDPNDVLGRTEVLADLAFCASTLHAFVPRIRMAQRFCDTDPDRVRAQAIELLRPQLDWVEARLAQNAASGGWWYGAEWSLVDVHLYWIWTAVTRPPGLDPASYPALIRHAAASETRPAVQRARAREAAIMADLA